MAQKCLVDGTAYDIKHGLTLIEGTGYEVRGGWTRVDGTETEIKFQNGTPISELAVGASVYMNVGGVRKAFLVVHQGLPSSMYDDSCNGTWLLMKDIYEKRAWHSTMLNTYETSTINDYLNGDFLNLFDSDIRSLFKQVKIPYRAGGGSAGTDQSGANGLTCTAFLLGGREAGYRDSDSTATANYLPVDGTKLDYFSYGTGTSAKKKRIAQLNGEAEAYHLRSPSKRNTTNVYYIDSTGASGSGSPMLSIGIRPALILPFDASVDESMNIIAA